MTRHSFKLKREVLRTAEQLESLVESLKTTNPRYERKTHDSRQLQYRTRVLHDVLGDLRWFVPIRSMDGLDEDNARRSAIICVSGRPNWVFRSSDADVKRRLFSIICASCLAMYLDCNDTSLPLFASPSISMSTGSCKLPGNPDIAGVGVRIAIYIQNLLCFIPAFWALADGKVTRGELDAAETQATTNLVLAFAILISSIVQAQTLGLTNYHASIVLNMSWMNNTNAFIYFLLYVQYKSQGNNRRRVPATWSAWARHIRGLAVSVIPSANRGRPGHDITDPEPEAGKSDNGVASSAHDAQRDGDNDSRRGAKILVKRFVLLLGSLHLTLMAGLGLWLWSNIRAFGEGQDTSNECAARHALVAILGSHVPFASEALRIASFIIYAIFLAPGLNLLLPIAIFLGLYSFWRVLPVPKDMGPGEVSVDSPFHCAWLRLSIRRVCNAIGRRWSMFPPFIGLVFLLAVNLVFIIDIELALKKNEDLQDKEEAVWGFGQILAMLLLFMPLRDLAETILARRTKQRQKDLDMGLGGAIKAQDLNMVLAMISRGANPNAELEEGISAMHMACKHENLEVIRTLLEAGADPNVKDGYRRDTYMVASDNTNCLRLLNKVEKGSLDGMTALIQAAQNGYGAAVKLLLPSLKIDHEDRQTFFEALSGLNVNARSTVGRRRTALLSAIKKPHEFEAIIEFLLTTPGIDANIPGADGWTPLSFAADRGHEAVVKLLLAAPGINVNTAKGGMTPLMLAVSRTPAHEAVVRALLTAPGIDVNAPDTTVRGSTPLISAVRYGNVAVVKLLCATPGIDGNARDRGWWTALTWATFHGKETMLKDLCAVPGTIVDVAHVKRRLEGPPSDFERSHGASKDKQDKCMRILEEFVESKSGGAHSGTEKPSGG